MKPGPQAECENEKIREVLSAWKLIRLATKNSCSCSTILTIPVPLIVDVWKGLISCFKGLENERVQISSFLALIW